MDFPCTLSLLSLQANSHLLRDAYILKTVIVLCQQSLGVTVSCLFCSQECPSHLQVLLSEVHSQCAVQDQPIPSGHNPPRSHPSQWELGAFYQHGPSQYI